MHPIDDWLTLTRAAQSCTAIGYGGLGGTVAVLTDVACRLQGSLVRLK
jgi:hypothetical protein